MSPYPSWQPGYRVSCCSIWSDFGSGSYCLSHPPSRLVLTLMSESWRAPLVSSCVAKAIPCKSKGQEGGEPRLRCRWERLLLHWFFFSSKRSSKADAVRENLAQNLQERKAPRLYQYVQEKESNTSKHIGRRKKTKKERKKDRLQLRV